MSAMRRDRNRLNSAGSFSAKYVLPRSFVKLAWRRNSMVKLSFQAKQRLAFLEFNQVVKDVSLTCRLFKISRQTFYKWKQRYDPSNLASLENLSRAPKTKRKGILTFDQEVKIKKLRKKHLRTGKIKLAFLNPSTRTYLFSYPYLVPNPQTTPLNILLIFLNLFL